MTCKLRLVIKSISRSYSHEPVAFTRVVKNTFKKQSKTTKIPFSEIYLKVTRMFLKNNCNLKAVSEAKLPPRFDGVNLFEELFFKTSQRTELSIRARPIRAQIHDHGFREASAGSTPRRTSGDAGALEVRHRAEAPGRAFGSRLRLPCICWASRPSALACVWAACTGRWTGARAWDSLATGTCTARKRPWGRCPRAASRCAALAVLDLRHPPLPCTLPTRRPWRRRGGRLWNKKRTDEQKEKNRKSSKKSVNKNK